MSIGMVGLSVRNVNVSRMPMQATGGSVTFWGYYRKVWRTATGLENRGWLKLIVGEVVPVVVGTVILILLLGFNSVIEARRLDLALLGIGLIALGAWRFVACLARAPHQIYLDGQRESQDELLQRQRNFESNRAAMQAGFDRDIAGLLEKIKTIVNERDLAREERDSLLVKINAPAPRAPTAGEIVQRFRAFAAAGRASPMENWNQFEDWFRPAREFAGECLFSSFAEELDQRVANIKKLNWQPVSAGVQACFGECISWFNGWQGKLNERDHLNPDFRMPTK
jgi:hypothetical protein